MMDRPSSMTRVRYDSFQTRSRMKSLKCSDSRLTEVNLELSLSKLNRNTCGQDQPKEHSYYHEDCKDHFILCCNLRINHEPLLSILEGWELPLGDQSFPPCKSTYNNSIQPYVTYRGLSPSAARGTPEGLHLTLSFCIMMIGWIVSLSRASLCIQFVIQQANSNAV